MRNRDPTLVISATAVAYGQLVSFAFLAFVVPTSYENKFPTVS